MPQHSDNFPPGTTLANGRYRIDRVLGEGGMGTVYEATEMALKRTVALKVLLPELSQHPTARHRMEAEAQAMARLSSQHVVRVNTVFDEQGLLVIDLEFMSGGSLADKLAAGPVDEGQAARWIAQILNGLEELHEVGLVHRDLKPANVMIDHRGTLKVTDLGIAHDSQRTTGFKTRHDANLGTAEYMAPEQIQSAATVDARVDVYAAGVILYELLTGRVPFQGEDWSVKAAHVRDAADLGPVRAVSVDLVEVVARALQKSPSERYSTAREMRKAVVEAAPEDWAELTGRPKARAAPRAPAVVPEVAPAVVPVAAAVAAAKVAERQSAPAQVAPQEPVRAKAAAVAEPSGKSFPLVPVLLVVAILAGVGLLAVSKKSAPALEEAPAVPAPAPAPAASAPTGYARIAPGEFWMGSPADEEGRFDPEVRHQVKITRGYWLKETEVTQGEWRAVMGSRPSGFSGCGDSCPVEQVSWEDAVAYCNKLSVAEGLQQCYSGAQFSGLGCTGYRLPTESEWEYAARAGTTGARYGDLDGLAWYEGNSGSQTHAVRGKTPNAWGLYDMLGNVFEWTNDWQDDYGGGRVADPGGPSTGQHRVVRGGGWAGDARNVRAARRDGLEPADRGGNLGFRPARSVP